MHPIRLLAIASFGALASLAPVSAAEPVGSSAVAFRDLSFVEASAEAGRMGKFVFVDFYTTWCAPCKKLDAETWQDPAVAALLDRHAIALKLDAERGGRELAERYAISAYPTLLLLNADGTEQDRIEGYRNAENFRREFSEMLKGPRRAARARTASDPAQKAELEAQVRTRLRLARELAGRGQRDEALAEYLWLFDDGMKRVPGFGAVRLTLARGELARLSRQHEPAAVAVRERRDAAKARFDADAGDREAGIEFAVLSEGLGDRAAVVAAFHALPNGDVRRRTLGGGLYRWFVAEREYRAALEARPPELMVQSFEATWAMSETVPADMRNEARTRTMQAAALDLEVLAGAGLGEQARELQAKLLAADSTDETKELLRTHLARAEHPEVLSK